MVELIRKYYQMGIYNDDDLHLFVRSGTITVEQAEQIRQNDRKE